MIDLKALAELAALHAADLEHAVAPFPIGDRDLDTDARPVLMGVINLSRTSTYRESVALSLPSAVQRARVLVAQGADVVDVGAECSDAASPRVQAQQQVEQLVPVVEALTAEGIAVSVETYDPLVAEPVLHAGARVLNLTGAAQDADLFTLAAQHEASVVLCHVLGGHARDLDGSRHDDDPIPAMLEHFAARIEAARSVGVRGIAIDPGMGLGFAQEDPRARVALQSQVLLGSFRLRALGVPVCHALPHAFALFTDQFRTAEGMFAVLAHLGGTGVYRTHEVPHVVAVLNALRELPVFPEQAPGQP